MAMKEAEWPHRRRDRGELVAAQYPWGDWFDGDVWHLVHGVDFAIPKKQFQLQAHGIARQFGMKIRTGSKYGGQDLWIQAL